MNNKKKWYLKKKQNVEHKICFCEKEKQKTKTQIKRKFKNDSYLLGKNGGDEIKQERYKVFTNQHWQKKTRESSDGMRQWNLVVFEIYTQKKQLPDE